MRPHQIRQIIAALKFLTISKFKLELNSNCRFQCSNSQFYTCNSRLKSENIGIHHCDNSVFVSFRHKFAASVAIFPLSEKTRQCCDGSNLEASIDVWRRFSGKFQKPSSFGRSFFFGLIFRWDEVDACNVIQPGKMLHLLEGAHSSWWKMLLF